MNKTIDVIETSFWKYIGTQMDQETFEFVRDFPMWSSFNNKWHVLLWTPLWVPYQKFQLQLKEELQKIFIKAPTFELQKFVADKKIDIPSWNLEELTSNDFIQKYLAQWNQREQEMNEKLAANPRIHHTPTKRKSEEIEIEYLWGVFENSMLQQVEQVLSWIESSDDRCRYYNSFNFLKSGTHMYAVSDETMSNNWHWPFQIDVLKIHETQEIPLSLHSASRYTVSQVDSLTWWYSTDSWFQELAKKYGEVTTL